METNIDTFVGKTEKDLRKNEISETSLKTEKENTKLYCY